MKFSVILTTYNRPERLKRAVDSVLNQTYQDFELLLMDDNSDSLDQIYVLNKYKNHPKVRLFISSVKNEDRSKKVRYSVLINEAIKKSTGDIIAYICDDDRYELNRLERFADFFRNNQDVYCVGGNQYCVREENGIEVPMPTHIRQQTRVLHNPNCCIDHTSFVHKKEVFTTVKNWSENPEHWGSADGEFFERLGKAGFPMHPLGGDPTDTHVYHDGSWTKDANWQQLGKSI